VEVVASLSQGHTAAAQCGLFTHKSVPVIFEPPCILDQGLWNAFTSNCHEQCVGFLFQIFFQTSDEFSYYAANSFSSLKLVFVCARATPLQLFVFEVCCTWVSACVLFLLALNEHPVSMWLFRKLFSTAVIRVSLRLYLNLKLKPICFFLHDLFYT